MSAATPERGRAGLRKDQPVRSVDFHGDTELSPDFSKESIWDLPSNAGEIFAKAVTQALDALEGRLA